MRWDKRIATGLAGAGASLLLAAPAYAVATDIVALVATFSSPPPKAFLIDVSNGSIGGLRLHAQAITYVHKFGIPDYIGRLESPTKVEYLWSRTTNPKSGWATIALHSPSSTTVDQVRFAGLFKTLRGDKRGTLLSAFLKHWQLEGPVVTGVVKNGALLEYNVVVGGIVFAFDEKRMLVAVGLADTGAERDLCVIPTACVAPKIS